MGEENQIRIQKTPCGVTTLSGDMQIIWRPMLFKKELSNCKDSPLDNEPLTCAPKRSGGAAIAH